MRAVRTVVSPLALRGVALAPVSDGGLAKLKTPILRFLCGATWLFRAREIAISILALGHKISPVMNVRYEPIIRLARVAQRPNLHASNLGVRAPAPGRQFARVRPPHTSYPREGC